MRCARVGKNKRTRVSGNGLIQVIGQIIHEQAMEVYPGLNLLVGRKSA